MRKRSPLPKGNARLLRVPLTVRQKGQKSQPSTTNHQKSQKNKKSTEVKLHLRKRKICLPRKLSTKGKNDRQLSTRTTEVLVVKDPFLEVGMNEVDLREDTQDLGEFLLRREEEGSPDPRDVLTDILRREAEVDRGLIVDTVPEGDLLLQDVVDPDPFLEEDLTLGGSLVLVEGPCPEKDRDLGRDQVLEKDHSLDDDLALEEDQVPVTSRSLARYQPLAEGRIPVEGPSPLSGIRTDGTDRETVVDLVVDQRVVPEDPP